ncbi:MAG: hypothetical protein ABSD49_13800 [Candidatus Bathyarchaeia archaeon]|jgi:hypothetical protein
MDWWPRKKGKVEGVTFEQLPGNAGFALDIEGNKILAVKLDREIVRELAGDANVGAGGAGGGVNSKTKAAMDWLLVTNPQNPHDLQWSPLGAGIEGSIECERDSSSG